MTDLVGALWSVLDSAGDPERAVQQQAYMKSALPFRGISAPELKALLAPVLGDPALRIHDRAEWDSAVRTVWDEATHREDRYAATALSGHRWYRAWQDTDTVPLYRHLIVTGAWWDHVDEIASRRIGPILRAHHEAVAPVVREWAVDDDLWIRRTAIICQLGSKDDTDDDLLVDAIVPNLADPDFFIRKAIGWALRQHARIDPDFVRAFVDEQGDRLSPLSRREALKHLGRKVDP